MKPLLITALLCALAVPAHALTAGDVAEKMNSDERSGWTFGAAEMAEHLFRRMGDEQRAICIRNWLGDGSYAREIDAALRANPAASAAAVVEALIKRRCGDYK